MQTILFWIGGKETSISWYLGFPCQKLGSAIAGQSLNFLFFTNYLSVSWQLLNWMATNCSFVYRFFVWGTFILGPKQSSLFTMLRSPAISWILIMKDASKNHLAYSTPMCAPNIVFPFLLNGSMAWTCNLMVAKVYPPTELPACQQGCCTHICILGTIKHGHFEWYQVPGITTRLLIVWVRLLCLFLLCCIFCLHHFRAHLYWDDSGFSSVLSTAW